MTDRDELEDRLDVVGDQLEDGDESPSEFASTIVYEDGDGGYETEDGDPVPTDDDGSPDIGGRGTLIILSGEYDPNDI